MFFSLDENIVMSLKMVIRFWIFLKEIKKYEYKSDKNSEGQQSNAGGF